MRRRVGYNEVIKPCPFCGSRDVYLYDDSGFGYTDYQVQCNNCNVENHSSIRERVIERWNSRRGEVE